MTPSVGVSVVLGTLNRSAELERALRTLLTQPPSAVPWEIIVCDNGSTDDTRTVVERLSRSSPIPVRYVFEPRRGVSHARNAGVAASSAPIVAFMDDDQDVAGMWLHAIVTAFRDHPDVDVLGGRVLPSWGNPPPAWVAAPMWGPVSVIDRGPVSFRVSRERWMCLPGGNAAWRRAVLLELGGFSADYPRSQDRELLVRALLAGHVGLYVPEMVVYHRLEGGRLTKPAFRRWNRMEGRMRAGFAFEEIFTANGEMRPVPTNMPRVLGVSRFVYRAWLAAFQSYAAASVRGKGEEAFRHEGRLLYLTSYIHRRIELTAADSMSLPHRTGAVVAHALSRAAALFLGTLC
jgi:glucosyl-dolichyl phosphate glucuronosyltransferase